VIGMGVDVRRAGIAGADDGDRAAVAVATAADALAQTREIHNDSAYRRTRAGT